MATVEYEDCDVALCFDWEGCCLVGGQSAALRVDLRDRTAINVLRVPERTALRALTPWGAFSIREMWVTADATVTFARTDLWGESASRAREFRILPPDSIRAARSAPVIAADLGGGSLSFVRLDGEPLGTLDVDGALLFDGSWGMSGDGTTLVVPIGEERLIVAKYQGDPRSLQLPP